MGVQESNIALFFIKGKWNPQQHRPPPLMCPRSIITSAHAQLTIALSMLYSTFKVLVPNTSIIFMRLFSSPLSPAVALSISQVSYGTQAGFTPPYLQHQQHSIHRVWVTIVQVSKSRGEPGEGNWRCWNKEKFDAAYKARCNHHPKPRSCHL